MNDLVALVESRAASDPQLRALIKRVKKQSADFNDTADYSVRLAQILGKEMSENVLDIPEELREEVATELLKYGYNDLNDVLAEVQGALDDKNGIHIRPQKAAFPAERVQQYVHSLVDPTVADSVIKRRARAGTETITKSYHDDYMKKNASFRNDAGLKCYIVRTAVPKCCEWCSNIAGRYPYSVDEMPEDVFHRHDNCNCKAIFENGKQRQDVWSKRTWEVPETGPGAESPAVFTEEQAKTIEQQNLQQFRGVKINNSSIDNSGGSGIITGRGSGNGDSINAEHTFEKIGEIDFSDKKAIAKSLQEFEQKYKDSRIEHCRVFCPNGEVYEVHGDLNNVNTDLLGDKMKGSINEHNHVIGEGKYTFSLKDVINSAADGSYISMAYDEKYRYSMTFSDLMISEDSVYESYQMAKKSVGDDLIFHPERIPIGDEEHERIKRTCKELGIKYSRVSR